MTKATPFQNYLLRWYSLHGRTELPWRQTTNPYHILVSEIMLQQTQVERVIPKYLAFIKRFPTISSLANASLSEVLTLWQGLGYNRRAKYLQQAAETIVNNHAGVFPQTTSELVALPGIGPYTAAAVATFAYNQPLVLIETNVRAVFIHHFFPTQSIVSDKELLTLIERELWEPNPREWYAALMDYGAALKRLIPNPSRRSKHHATQSTFRGSLRQVRGEVIKLLTNADRLSEKELASNLHGNKAHLQVALNQLIQEKMITRSGSIYSIAS